MKHKRIYLNLNKTKYCIVELHKTKKSMQVAYNSFKPTDKNHKKVLGVHCGYEKYKNGNGVVAPETGRVFLSLEHCGAGVVSHEIAHAVLWAWKHKKYKKQYPITINNMEQEEKILHNLTYAVRQFYDWYWKVKGTLK